MMGSMLMFNLMFGLFVIMIVFISLDKATSGTMYNDTVDELNDTDTTFSQDIKDTVVTMNNAWLWIPGLALFGLVYMIISNTQAGG